MFRSIREIPPAPRNVRWRAVLWHRWPIALLGFVLAIYGGVFTSMLYFAAGGKASDDVRLDLEPTLTAAKVTAVRPIDATAEEVSYWFVDATGYRQNGRSYADPGRYRVSSDALVEYVAGQPTLHRLEGTRTNLLPTWVDPSVFFGLLVLPGLLALGLWFQGVFDLKRMMNHGDVGVAEVLEARRLALVLPSTVAVCYRFRDHRAILRVGRHWVRTRSALGEHLSTQPRHMPVLHHRRWPQFSRLALVQDFHKSAAPSPTSPGEVRPRA